MLSLLKKAHDRQSMHLNLLEAKAIRIQDSEEWKNMNNCINLILGEKGNKDNSLYVEFGEYSSRMDILSSIEDKYLAVSIFSYSTNLGEECYFNSQRKVKSSKNFKKYYAAQQELLNLFKKELEFPKISHEIERDFEPFAEKITLALREDLFSLKLKKQLNKNFFIENNECNFYCKLIANGNKELVVAIFLNEDTYLRENHLVGFKLNMLTGKVNKYVSPILTNMDVLDDTIKIKRYVNRTLRNNLWGVIDGVLGLSGEVA